MASYIWSLADLLRGDFKQSQYGRIILPFTLLRRLEGVLEKSKEKVLSEYKKIKKKKLPEAGEEKLLLRATGGLSFFNISKMDLSKLGESSIKDNLESYLQGFSKDAREIFEYFNFAEFIGQLNDANLLYKVVQKVRQADLSPKAISNHDMGLVFEELIRRFAESSNETAGEHFIPRDIVRLTTSLVFMEDDDALTKPGIIRTIYDPTAGTGGFLSSGMEYVPDSDLRDHENVALDPGKPVNELNEAYFSKEVLPHVPEAWIDGSKKDIKDQEIGIVGYEIPFNRHFYVYQPPRDLREIDADLDQVSGEIMRLLREVRS